MKTTHPTCLLFALAASTGAAQIEAKTVYVDNASTCTASCGLTLATAHKDLRTGVAAMVAGDTLKIAPSTTPYYYFPGGVLPAGVNRVTDALINLNGKTSPSLRTTITSTDPTSSTLPIIRGSLKFGPWTPDGPATINGVANYRYRLSFPMMRSDVPNSTAKLEPQQIFRSVGGVEKQLTQVGGAVFGGYPDNPPADMTQAVSGFANVWPGRVAPALDANNQITLEPDQFYYAGGTLYVRLSSALAPNEKLEVSVQRQLVHGSGLSNVDINHLRFERSSTSSYSRSGALALEGADIRLSDLQVYDADAQCLDLAGNGNQVSYSVFMRCGQTGIRAIGSNVLVTVNTIRKSNTRGFLPAWEAGGMKSIGGTALQNSTITYNDVSFNYGDGIWLDSGNNGNTIQKNVVAYNDGVGVHIELSSGEKILDNIIMGNGGQGIQLVDSANNLITGNRIVGNVNDAILAMDDGRIQPPLYVTTGNVIKSNFMGWNDDVVNHKAVWVTSNSTLDLNRYCGTGATTDPTTGKLSMHFWASNLPNGANVFRFSDWKTQGGSSRDLNSKMFVTPVGGSVNAKTYFANKQWNSYLNLTGIIDGFEAQYCPYQ